SLPSPSARKPAGVGSDPLPHCLPQGVPVLDNDLKAQLKGYLERLQRPVSIIASVDAGDSSKEMLELLEDIRSQSGMVTVEVRRDDAERKPSFALTSPGHDIALRFAEIGRASCRQRA